MSPFHNLGIMRGKDEGRTSNTIEMFHHIEEGDSSGRVQIRRGLICQNECGFCNHGASHGNPLLLPARQLRRATILQAGEANFRKQLFHPFSALARRHPLEKQRKLGVFQSGKDGQQVVRLEHKAYALQTQMRQLT